MARPELGVKRVCPTTGRKFYDLGRDPIVSPYTGEALPRAAYEPLQSRGGGAARPRPAVEDEVEEVAPAGPELVSLEDVGSAEEEAAVASEDETALADDDAATDDTFLEEEEGAGDVSDLIDGDIEEDEEG